MAVFLPILAEAVTLAAEGATEAAILEQLGGKASQAIASEVASQVSSYVISHGDEILDTIFGPGTAKEFHKELNQNMNESEDFLNDFEFGYPQGTSASKRKQQEMDKSKLDKYKQKQIENQIYEEEMNKNLADLYRKEHEDPNFCKCPESKPVDVEITKVPKTPIEIPTNPNNDGVINVDPGAVTDKPNSLTPKIETLTTQSDQYGSRTAEFIVKFILHSLEKKDVPISEFYMNNPQLMQIGKHYIDWARTQQVKKLDTVGINRVYNGKNIKKEGVFRYNNGEGVHFAIYDETQKVEYYDGRAAPRGASTTQLIGLGFIPPIHGVWMGPKSPNNDVPIDLVDTFSMMHDIEYNNHGWFYEEGDLKYISRLSQNMDRMGFIESYFAKFGIKWFSTVGSALAKVAGSLKNPSESEESSRGDDFFTYLHNTSSGISATDNTSSESVSEGSYIEYNVDKLNQKIESRKTFYTEFKNTAEELFKLNAPPIGQNSGVDTLTSLTKPTSNPLIEFLKNLPVEYYTN